MASIRRMQEFIREYTDKVAPLPVDPLLLLAAWDREYNDYKEFIRNEHLSILQADEAGLREGYTEPGEAYYYEAINKYAVDQDDVSLSQAAELLCQNIRDNYIDDRNFQRMAAEILREEVKPAVIPDDEP